MSDNCNFDKIVLLASSPVNNFRFAIKCEKIFPDINPPIPGFTRPIIN